jgi:hypothetical protein
MIVHEKNQERWKGMQGRERCDIKGDRGKDDVKDLKRTNTD